jgi:hypothetical protein
MNIDSKESKELVAYGFSSGLLSINHEQQKPKKAGYRFKCIWCGHLNLGSGKCNRCGKINRSRIPSLVLLLALFLTGCRTYHYVKADSDGTVKVRVLMFLSNTKVEYMKVQFFTNRVDIVVRKGSTEIDDEAVKAIAEGVTSAVIKAIEQKP